MINLEKIGSKISDLRKQHNMKQNELADQLFVTHQAVSKWENGKSFPSVDILYDLTKLFNISIDYLLDDAEVNDADFETQLRLYPRKSVISKFINENNLDEDIDKIFYLLNRDERENIIELIISKKINIQIENIWHLLNSEEREYLLGIILSNKFKYDLSNIYHRLSYEELQLVKTRSDEGIYHYYLHETRIIKN